MPGGNRLCQRNTFPLTSCTGRGSCYMSCGFLLGNLFLVLKPSKVLFSTQFLLENKHTCTVLTEGTPEAPGVAPLLLTPRAVPGGQGGPRRCCLWGPRGAGPGTEAASVRKLLGRCRGSACSCVCVCVCVCVSFPNRLLSFRCIYITDLFTNKI